MIERFLRRPTTGGAWAADVVRVAGAVSVLVAGLGWSIIDAGILALALPALLLPRFVGVRPGLDVIYGVSVLVAAWSNVLELYTSVPGWDLVVHFVCTGVIALVLYLLAGRLDIVRDALRTRPPARIPLVLVTVTGLAISAVWEMIEWAGYTFISDDIFVAYVDTIGDMAAGGLGALVAGAIAARVRLLEPADVPAPAGAGSVR
jgi:uncharacterized membrane protein YjdF